MRPTGAAQRRTLLRDYSRCTLINTRAASKTPIASIPIAIWPSIMLSRVHTTIVDPSSIGMAAVPAEIWGLTEPEKLRCNGCGVRFIPAPGKRDADAGTLCRTQRQARPLGFRCRVRQAHLQTGHLRGCPEGAGRHRV